MRHSIGRYTIETRQLNDPAEPEQWYWHVYRDEVKINGGIADSEEQALFAAGRERVKALNDWPSMLPSEHV